MNSLYPHTTYGCESGGDPEAIPELTYEEYLDFHGSSIIPPTAISISMVIWIWRRS